MRSGNINWYEKFPALFQAGDFIMSCFCRVCDKECNLRLLIHFSTLAILAVALPCAGPMHKVEVVGEHRPQGGG